MIKFLNETLLNFQYLRTSIILIFFIITKHLYDNLINLKRQVSKCRRALCLECNPEDIVFKETGIK